MARQPEQVHRLMLVVDEDPTRIESVALAVHATAPNAKILVFDATANDGVTAAIAAANDAARNPGATVMIIRADPASWTTVTVLAALRPPHHTGPVDAIVVTEGPLERLPVLVTDFPGLRLLPPDSSAATTVAALVTADDAGGQLPV